ncbi:hypothetical protein CRI70_19745 [Streptomyces sp. Ru87]|nr:hypothetical protein CRI70_19745 [Streptomyces sp. Ru87]
MTRRHLVAGALVKTLWWTAATTATFREAVRDSKEVVPVNAVSAWVLPSGVMVGRRVVRERRLSTPERHDHACHF